MSGSERGECAGGTIAGEAELFTTRLIVSSGRSKFGAPETMRIRLIPVFPLACFFAVASVARAQPEPLNSPVPFAAAGARAASPGSVTAALRSARQALELGFPATAAEIYRGLLGAPGTDTRAVTLAWSAALLADGRATEAVKLLDGFKGARDAAWHLQAALAQMQLNKIDLVRGAVSVVKEKEGELLPEERGWWFYLQGLVAETGGDRRAAAEQAKAFYQQAASAAVSTYARVRFQIAEVEAQLRLGAVSEPELERSRRLMEENQGRAQGYTAARTYAVGLSVLGRREAAVAVLRQQLLGLPAQERTWGDDFRLLMGLIAGAGEGVGRNELLQLLASGRDVERQRMALALLAEKSTQEPARGQLRAELSRLIAVAPPHAIIEDLRLFRANFLLDEKNYAAAEEDAQWLLEKFPGSALKPLALGVLTSSAWEQRRYRTAAVSATRAAEALPPGRQRADLGVFVAEAWFRAGDFRSAADAYAGVLRDLPPGAKAGELMFQRVQAEIEAGSPEAAQPVLDELAGNPAFDPESRWQAEWNLARALMGKGTTEGAAAAYARVNRLLAGPTVGLKPELRAKMKWLQARLAFETGDPQRTRELVAKELPALLEGLEPGPKREEIASTAALLAARASFALKDEPGALAALEKLRGDFPRTDAAVVSYIEAANHYAEQENAVKAQQLFTELAEKFPNKELAPFALYQAALQAERRGQNNNLEEANDRLERLVTKYPSSALVFSARLKQGDVMMNLNQFPKAQQDYQLLVDNFAANPDVVLAQLALAKCHNAQSVGDAAHAESALVLFEHVWDRVDAPVDVRVEAGYNRGALLAGRGESEKAAAAWWQGVVGEFLFNPKMAERLGAKGRFWMTRTLLELGALREQQGKLDEAQEAWRKILEAKLPGDALAKARLAPYGGPEAKP